MPQYKTTAAQRANAKAYYYREKANRPEAYNKKARLRTIKAKYGLSENDLAQLFQDFHHACSLCEATTELCVDHDHQTGAIRGILCRPCNTALGRLGDTQQTIMRALLYLRRAPWQRKQ